MGYYFGHLRGSMNFSCGRITQPSSCLKAENCIFARKVSLLPPVIHTIPKLVALPWQQLISSPCHQWSPSPSYHLLSLFASSRPPQRPPRLLAAVPVDLRGAALQNQGARLRNVSAKVFPKCRSFFQGHQMFRCILFSSNKCIGIITLFHTGHLTHRYSPSSPSPWRGKKESS